MILPHFFDLNGVWAASPATEYLMAAVVMVMLSKEFDFLRNSRKVEIKQPVTLKITSEVTSKHETSASRNTVKTGNEECTGFIPFKHTEREAS